jgi:hypothetical protein
MNKGIIDYTHVPKFGTAFFLNKSCSIRCDFIRMVACDLIASMCWCCDICVPFLMKL